MSAPVSESSATFPPFTVFAAIVGFGNVPVRSPPAVSPFCTHRWLGG